MSPYFTYVTHFAQTAESADTGIIAGLGIDWTLLALQLIAFLVLVALLGKFVYPVFMRIIDEREEKIQGSIQAAEEAKQQADDAESRIEKQLSTARKEARDIVATAKDEATALLQKADEKSKANAEHMLTTARDEIEKETIAARKTLHNETIELVAQATQKVVANTHSEKADASVITAALKEAQKS